MTGTQQLVAILVALGLATFVALAWIAGKYGAGKK